MGRILLVAEPAAARDDMAGAIAAAPHTVRAVSPGDLRIASAREWDPDVIVMDLATDSAALPLRMGMLRDPLLSSVPFIVLGDSEDEARALGAHAFVRTPAHLESLVRVIGHFSSLKMPLPV
jgi:CheY-like chemotaxis protein